MDQSGKNNHNWRGGVSANKYRYKKQQKARHPEKVKAHAAVAYAVRKGKLVRSACEGCGDLDVQAHHDDYSKKLEVRWFCRPCHRSWHIKIGRPMGHRPGRHRVSSLPRPVQPVDKGS